jgi:hypothetical protein
LAVTGPEKKELLPLKNDHWPYTRKRSKVKAVFAQISNHF